MENINAPDQQGTVESAFAPANPTDGRETGMWQTRFPPEARNKIKREAFYLGLILFLIPVLLLTIHTDIFGFYQMPRTIKKYTYAWIGGTLGGALFAIKWLYHTVARNLWNLDRWLWRFFTPHLSAGLAFAFIVLISSGLINIFSPEALQKNSAVVGLSFLIGYFSDSAIAKLTEIATTLFGETRKDKEVKKNN